MPIQAPQWTDYLNCPVCCREFGPKPRSPISLACGHTICKLCLSNLHRRQCPFDQSIINLDLDNVVINTALLQLTGYSPPTQPFHPPSINALSYEEQRSYDTCVKSIEELAVYLKYTGVGGPNGCRLSRPMQRKLVTLVQSAITEEEGRVRAYRAARSLGERSVTELILQHQNPTQLTAHLWAAVRARGCQFLGPAMQEEVLKLVLLALEDGSALSRKILVMFVVQRLEPHFPQASKTSIGHVVQLLYRASCFKVSKRESESSLMQLKEEFRTYEALRREHDTQIVQVAIEAGLRIAPDQWSALLYGDTSHKSHMQSIIDKLQTPQSFAQSVQELSFWLQRTSDPAHLGPIIPHLESLARIDTSTDWGIPTWETLAVALTSVKIVIVGLVEFSSQNFNRETSHNGAQQSTPTHSKYKVSMCRDAVLKGQCPRGDSCTFAHSEDEMERYRARNRRNNHRSPNSSQIRAQDMSSENPYTNQLLSPKADQRYHHNSTPNFSPPFDSDMLSVQFNLFARPPQAIQNNKPIFPDSNNQIYVNQQNLQNLAGMSPVSVHQSSNGFMPNNDILQYPNYMMMQQDSNNANSIKTNQLPLQQDATERNALEFMNANSLNGISTAYNNKKAPNNMPNRIDRSDLGNFPINCPLTQQDLFVRSDSILTDDEYVPCEAPSRSKYGPISRLNVQRPIRNGTSSSGYTWTAPNSQQMFQLDTMAQALSSVNNNGVNNQHTTILTKPTSSNVDQNNLPLNQEGNGVKMPKINERDRARQQRLPSTVEDNYELGIANEMLVLELKWEHELQEAEKRWSSEDEAHK